MKTKILVVDDDRNICDLICLYLEKEGYETKPVFGGKHAVSEFLRIAPGLVILDLMLPDVDGLQICTEIRKTSFVPIIMLTAKGEVFDKVLGLSLGADDYIVKPFDPKELVARVKAILRRSEKSIHEKNAVVYPNLTIDKAAITVTYRENLLVLPPKEFELLLFLASHPNQAFTREQLLENIWGFDFYGDTRTVDVHIMRLRDKFHADESWGIKTVWGVGYKFDLL